MPSPLHNNGGGAYGLAVHDSKPYSDGFVVSCLKSNGFTVVLITTNGSCFPSFLRGRLLFLIIKISVLWCSPSIRLLDFFSAA